MKKVTTTLLALIITLSSHLSAASAAQAGTTISITHRCSVTPERLQNLVGYLKEKYGSIIDHTAEVPGMIASRSIKPAKSDAAIYAALLYRSVPIIEAILDASASKKEAEEKNLKNAIPTPGILLGHTWSTAPFLYRETVSRNEADETAKMTAFFHKRKPLTQLIRAIETILTSED